MSIFDGKKQHVGDGSNAIQVAGDATIGNSTTEVIAICELVISNKMVALRDEAFEIAIARARQFGQEIAEKISTNVDEHIMDKLRDPDVQFAINQAVTQVVRKGSGTKSEVLKELIVSKINNEEEQEDLIIDHAIEVTQRLTTNEIKFLSLIIYFREVHKVLGGENLRDIIFSGTDSLKSPGLTVEQCQNIYSSIYTNYTIDFSSFLGEIESLKSVDVFMLNIKGCLISGQSFRDDFTILIKKLTTSSPKDEGNFNNQYPLISDILARFGIDSAENFNQIVPSPIGRVIAKNYLISRKFFE
ncbi:LPO_1073/Vpar_1526 family protein [Pantoea ananatis]|uniref:LPO_1073/Vpar_1526 family protein n=1 Tax=Pantoea ananas TaxID=553 RepID=UPI001B3188AD|nr:LPO_1073/Vpar_1526 family protein [Pantoea ananatis]